METPFSAYQGDEPYIFVCYAHEDNNLGSFSDMALTRDLIDVVGVDGQYTTKRLVVFLVSL